MHLLVRLTFEALSRRFGVDPADMWLMLDRKKKAPRWLVDALLEVYEPLTEQELNLDIDESLPSVPNGTRVRAPVQPQPTIGGREGRPALEHPFTRWLHGQGKTVTEWAASNRLDRGTVKFWYIEGGRPIPRHWADTIAAESDGAVPATARTWKNGIREPK